MSDILVCHNDDRGSLLALNRFSELSFFPKRIFSVIDVPKGVVRGEHAHYITKQLLVCIKGEIEVGLYNKEISNVVCLKQGDTVYIDEMTWAYQKFLTGKDFLMVLASTEHDPEDYIMDRYVFDNLIKTDIL